MNLKRKDTLGGEEWKNKNDRKNVQLVLVQKRKLDCSWQWWRWWWWWRWGIFHKQSLAHIHCAHLQTNAHTYTHIHTDANMRQNKNHNYLKNINHFVIDAISLVIPHRTKTHHIIRLVSPCNIITDNYYN